MTEYRKPFGSRAMHVSASGGTQPLDEYFLKLFISHNLDISFPPSAKMVAGNAVQRVVDLTLGFDFEHNKKMSFDEALHIVQREYSFYKPRTYDDGKDAEEHAEIKPHLLAMAYNASNGLHEYFGKQSFEGERKEYMDVDQLDVPVVYFIDYRSNNKMIDLKTSYPVRNPIKKDGTRTWRVPKPQTKPNTNRVIQQAVYWKATGLTPALLFVTAEGYEIATPETTELLSNESLEHHFNIVKQRWLVQQNIMKKSKSWREAFDMVQPDLERIKAYHGDDIYKIAKVQWNIQ
tara:strand:- start:423 stop:1292 length:870 start_codon:yes stop_codon:yes gene_type:complete